MLDSVINDVLKSAIEYKYQRNFYVYTGTINAMYQGAIKSILQSNRKPKEKNIDIMKAMVENQLAYLVVNDNVYEGTRGFTKSIICGKEYEA